MVNRNDRAADKLDERNEAASRWAAARLGLDAVQLEPVSGDASFRRYFRLESHGRSLILMDAPPDKESSAPFVDVSRRLRAAGLNAPEILEFDLDSGFGLLEDFGDTLYREVISEDTIDKLAPGLFGILDSLARRVDSAGLPEYDQRLLQAELDLFSDWYLSVHRGRRLTLDEAETWQTLCAGLIKSAREQQQVFVHRDFHSCNLLATSDGPGIIDFQDAVLGPLSYDFVSLAWDRYIAWPREKLETWMALTHQLLPTGVSLEAWIRQCDLMGLQRNLKIVGIFSRLKYRDNKDGYVEMIPRFYGYLLDVLPRYTEFSDFLNLLERPECAP